MNRLGDKVGQCEAHLFGWVPVAQILYYVEHGISLRGMKFSQATPKEWNQTNPNLNKQENLPWNFSDRIWIFLSNLFRFLLQDHKGHLLLNLTLHLILVFLALPQASKCLSPFTSCFIGISPTSPSPMVYMRWITLKLYALNFPGLALNM